MFCTTGFSLPQLIGYTKLLDLLDWFLLGFCFLPCLVDFFLFDFLGFVSLEAFSVVLFRVLVGFFCLLLLLWGFCLFLYLFHARILRPQNPDCVLCGWLITGVVHRLPGSLQRQRCSDCLNGLLILYLTLNKQGLSTWEQIKAIKVPSYIIFSILLPGLETNLVLLIYRRNINHISVSNLQFFQGK